MTETQIVWINQLKKGNELAAFNLYNSYSKAMYNTLTRITNDQEVAKDLLQEAFAKAFRRINDLEEPKAFAGWLKRIVVNLGLEYARKKKFYFEDIENQNQLESEEVDDKLIDDNTLHHAIKELPDGCRTILCLHLLEGYKHKEIAEQLGISESTSKTQFRHAKKLLKNKLQHHYEY
ncbi:MULTISPECIES: sigma-70 family RNA polymerase sigma factor [unclassified Ekhidna]|uniref:RNA polymerase sigma factor n=1 Tax=unclassified Ekhidna TaxID=2632188 RepID=UPI0032E02E68